MAKSAPDLSEERLVLLSHVELEAENSQVFEGLGEASETDWVHYEEGLREFLVGKVDDLAWGCWHIRPRQCSIGSQDRRRG